MFVVRFITGKELLWNMSTSFIFIRWDAFCYHWNCAKLRANYVAFGAIYATDSKPEAGNIGLETLKLAKEKLNVPLCAIGGLTVENSKDVIESGADYCAVISDILGLPMNAIPERLDEWSALFQATA